jgi:3-(3-hydroxy-phenyl)propionate hydroxylase
MVNAAIHQASVPDFYDVLIVGGGPTGLVLANLLGLAGVRTAVLERAIQVYPVPRATHIDEETLRHFQLTGLMAELEPHTSPFGVVELFDEDGAVVFQEEVTARHTVHHYLGSRFFDQPAFERILRAGLSRFSHVALLTGKHPPHG